MKLHFLVLMLALTALPVSAGPARPPAAFSKAETVTEYAPMKPFEAFAGRVMRGEGTGPDGASFADIASWQFILGGRALESIHRIEGGSYGGKTIIFYDESAKEYVFHYFTTAGFHTVGKLDVVEGGFEAVEKVIGHATFAEVRSRFAIDGDTIAVTSMHVTKDGKEGKGEGRVYRMHDGAPPSFDDR